LTDANVTVGGTLAPGLSSGLLTIEGALAMGSASEMEIELAGTVRGSGYDALNVSGTVSLNGTLSIHFSNGFQNTVNETDVFMLLESPTINGLFSNVGDGERLTTSDGFGSFLIDYEWATGAALDRVFLSDFEPIPEPATWGALSALSLAGYGAMRCRMVRS
jgi:hypothetical protein